MEEDQVSMIHTQSVDDPEVAFQKGLLAISRRDDEAAYTEAIEWWTIAGTRGHAEAQYNLGFVHNQGLGVTQCFAEALRWYRLSADQNNTSAMYNLGVMYSQGDGVPRDDATAVRLFRKAADLSDALAQCNLGLMYLT